MSTDTSNVSQQPPVHNAPPQGQQNDATLSPETVQKFFEIFLNSKENVEGEAAVDQTESIKILLGDAFGKTFESINISHPDLPIANELILQLAMGYVIDKTDFGKLYDLAGLANSVASAHGLPADAAPLVKCAFLGGLVMVALTELLSNYAKGQSAIEKMMSEFWIQTENLLKDLAKSISQNILQKAQDQMISNILQAGLTAVGIGVQTVGSVKALHVLDDAMKSTNTLVQQNAAAKSQIINAFGQSGGQIFSGVATKAVEGSFAYEIGTLDAINKLLENIEQQLQKMVDKFSQEGSEASKKVAEVLELLRNMCSALLQAFKGLGGGR